MSISKQLKQAIRAYPSVYRLAKDTGISQPVLSRFVRGDRDLHLATVDRLCDFFGMRLTKPTRKPPKRKS
jgi:transcriptional regulator with XRE-family HTH domain